MLTTLKQNIAPYYRNFWGWQTQRKIVVIESDDWGSIRMPSKEVYINHLNAGYPVNLNPYERFDSLADQDDLELLFDLLASYRDSQGNHPVMTANCVVANPDFNKIKSDDFRQYHYELITETFKSYPKHSNNFSLWAEGKSGKVFHPQFHAREHLNVSKFMQALKSGDQDVLFGFQHKMPGSIRKGMDRNGNIYVEATNYNTLQDKVEKLKIYEEGLDLFVKLFGYQSLSIIPPNYIWSKDFSEAVSKKGVKYIQGMRKMKTPNPGKPLDYTNRYLGRKNSFKQIDLVRNVTFEPSLINISNAVEQALNEVAVAFRMRKPAIISSYRINYVGFIEQSNRDKNLKNLKSFLSAVLKKWPDVEFMSSHELGHLINSSK